MTSIFLSPPPFNDFVVNNKGNDMPLGNKTKDVCHYGTRFSGGTKINDAYLWIKSTFRHLKKIIRSTHYYPAQLPQGTLISNNKTLTCYFLKIEISFFFTNVIIGWTLYDLFSGHMHRNWCRGPWGSHSFVTETERVYRNLSEIWAGTFVYSLMYQDGVY